MTKYR